MKLKYKSVIVFLKYIGTRECRCGYSKANEPLSSHLINLCYPRFVAAEYRYATTDGNVLWSAMPFEVQLHVDNG